MMGVFYILLLSFLVACSEKSNEAPLEDYSISSSLFEEHKPSSSSLFLDTSLNLSSETLFSSSSSNTYKLSSSLYYVQSSSSLLPIESFSSSSYSADSLSMQDLCLKIVNDYRASESILPLNRATQAQDSCTLAQSALDLEEKKAHGHFGKCKERAQNTGPSISLKHYNTETKILTAYLKMMWEDEKEMVLNGETEYNKIGHYLNMKNESYHSLACEIAYDETRSVAWLNMNFF